MKITKRQLKRIIREEHNKLLSETGFDLPKRFPEYEGGYGDKPSPKSTLESWAAQDDAVDQVGDGEYEMYCDEHNGQEELRNIIERLREVYALGGGVSMIKIEDISSQG